MFRILLLIFVIISYTAVNAQNFCVKNRFSNTPQFADAQIKKDSNIVFAVARHWNSNVMDSLRMDIYAPNSSVDSMSRRPLIVFAFGGGFLEGNRTEMAFFCKEFAKRGYVAATIDYRIGWNCLNGTAAAFCLCNDYISMKSAMYRAIQDYNASLRFLCNKSAQFGIDTNYFFVSGGSAGSITALHAAFMSQSEINAQMSWAQNQLGGIDSSGNKYPKNYKIRGVLDFCGAVFDTSCMNDNKDIAVVSFHDSTDCVVPAYKGYIINCTGNCYNLFTMEGSALIYRKARMNGNCAALNINPIVAHCGSNYSYVIREGSCFLKNILCNNCKSERNANETKVPNCDSLGFNSGIRETVKNGAVRLYPQPASNIINYDIGVAAQEYLLTITDMNGKTIFQQFSASNKGFIETGTLANGFYLFTARNKEAMVHSKIVINR